MPYTIEDFQKEYVREHIHRLTPEERLEGLSRDEILSVLKKEFSRLNDKEIRELLNQLKSEE